jgi:hypothetical protein
MDEADQVSVHDANAINDRMVQQMEERRRERQERRTRPPVSPSVERRRICGYCFQRGDHQTAAQCMRALERADNVLNASDQ